MCKSKFVTFYQFCFVYAIIRVFRRIIIQFFFKSILLFVNSRLSKIRSVRAYVMSRTVYFGWICMYYVGHTIVRTIEMPTRLKTLSLLTCVCARFVPESSLMRTSFSDLKDNIRRIRGFKVFKSTLFSRKKYFIRVF